MMPEEPQASEVERLSSISPRGNLHPWRRAQVLTQCFLYWMPVSCFPLPAQERTWVMEFLDRFVAEVTAQFELRTEVFLQYGTVKVLREPFLRTAREFSPLRGWSRRPGTELGPMPTPDEIKELIKRKQFDISWGVPDYCYWFRKKAHKRQRQAFVGHGGVTLLFLKEDPDTQSSKLPFPEAIRKRPEYLPQINQLEEMLADAFALRDGFLAKSKELLGGGLNDHPQFEAIPFVLPLLYSEDFFNRPVEECGKWFQLFDIYINESPADRGIILASKIDLEEKLIALLTKMREEDLAYPERK